MPTDAVGAAAITIMLCSTSGALAAASACPERSFEAHANAAYKEQHKKPTDYLEGAEAIRQAWKFYIPVPYDAKKVELAIWFILDKRIYSVALYVDGCLYRTTTLTPAEYWQGLLTVDGKA